MCNAAHWNEKTNGTNGFDDRTTDAFCSIHATLAFVHGADILTFCDFHINATGLKCEFQDLHIMMCHDFAK